MSIQYLFQIWLWFSETVPTSGKLYSMLYCCHILKREIKYCIFLKRRKQEIVPKWGNKGTHLRITRLWQGFQHRDYTTYSSKEPTGVTHTPCLWKAEGETGAFLFFIFLSQWCTREAGTVCGESFCSQLCVLMDIFPSQRIWIYIILFNSWIV